MEKITSASNGKIKRVAALQQKARVRREEKAFVIEGMRLFLDTPDSFLSEIYITEQCLAQIRQEGEQIWRDGEQIRQEGERGRAMRSMINESTNQVNQNGADSSSSGRRRETAWEKWNRLCAGGCFCAVIPQELMWRICDTQTPQGILCVARQPHYELEEILEGTVVQTSGGFSPEIAVQTSGVLSPEIAAQTSGMPSPGIAVQISGLGGSDRAGRFAPPPLLLLLEDIQDPGNLGTMIRTAEAAGVTGIVMSRGTVDVFNPKTVRATMSALFRMPFFCAEDFVGTLGRIREKGIAIYAAHLEGARSYESCSYIEGTALLIGNEGNGLSDEAASAADYRIILPMRGRIESLNAAVAASVLLYEADRQRRMTE